MSTKEEFTEAVLTFGSDLDRWPVKTRSLYSALISSGDVDDVLAEAHALDAVLNHAPSISQQSAESVAAGIMRNLPESAPVELVVPGGSTDGFENMKNGPGNSAWRIGGVLEAWKLPTISERWRQRGAVLLAASFVLGIAAGAGGLGTFASDAASQVGADDAVFAELAPLLDDQDEENLL